MTLNPREKTWNRDGKVNDVLKERGSQSRKRTAERREEVDVRNSGRKNVSLRFL